MSRNEASNNNEEKLLRKIDFLKDQIKKLTAGELRQHKLQQKLDFQFKTQKEIAKLGYLIQTVRDEKVYATLLTETLVECFGYEKAIACCFKNDSFRELTEMEMEGYYNESVEEVRQKCLHDLSEMINKGTCPDIFVQNDIAESVIGMNKRVVLVCRSTVGVINGFVVFGNSMEKNAYHRPVSEPDRALWETIQRVASSALENIYLYKQLATEQENLKLAHDKLKNINDRLERIVQQRTAELARSREEYRLLYLESEQTSEKFRSLIDSAADPIVVYDDKGTCIYVNPAFVRIFGWKFAEIKNRNNNFALPFGKREDEKIINLVMQKKGIYNLETKRKTIDGRILDISVSAAAHFDKEGNYAGCILQLRDITEQKIMEVEILKIRNLESLGLLAGGIAHDFNNIFSGILMNTQLSQMNIDKPAEAAKYLQSITDATGRAEMLAGQLLTFAQGGAPVKKFTSIEKFIREVVEFSLRGSSVKCEFDIEDGIWAVEIDVGQMNQVIQNLIINAQQAMPCGGVIRISLKNVTLEKEQGNKVLHIDQSGNFVVIAIQDSGVGIPRANLVKIFDPYFTTKEKNSGLGLSITYSIVRKHNGHITADSEAGRGSTFTIYLPASGKVLPNIKPEPVVQKTVAGGGLVLVMDDEKMILDLIEEVLKRIGYEVDRASDGRQAIELYKKAKLAGKPHNIVIMDLTIPGGMGGKETIAELMAINPDIKAIVSSGYSNDSVMADYKAYGFCGVLKKPFKINDLISICSNIHKGN